MKTAADPHTPVNRTPALLWFRNDLRLADHPALQAAIASGSPVLPVFIWSPEEEAPWSPGGASRWWLHQSLRELQAALRRAGSTLVIRRGPTAAALQQLAEETGARDIFWSRRYEPAELARERHLVHSLRARGITAHVSPGNLLFEPGAICNGSGNPFQVFTPFYKACLAMPAPPEPLKSPTRLAAPKTWPASLDVADLRLAPRPDWAGGLRQAWQPGERGASAQLESFWRNAADSYAVGRDRPDLAGTSRLSPHLHFGEITPRQIWHAAGSRDAGPYLRQIIWREFAYHLLVTYPQTPSQPLRPEFRGFPWRVDEAGLRAWTRGATGYPLVDAGMRELWRTGWMHNRVRMVAASFLVKHLLIPWQEGAAWFWDTLVDADLANNTMGWQWTAGCGADAAPYFRIFNPVLQGEKFDPQAAYVRRWVPELAALPDAFIQQPWNAPPLALRSAGVRLGESYPTPLVHHDTARKRALAALAHIKTGSRKSEGGS